jgi:hypothetical protein
MMGSVETMHDDLKFLGDAGDILERYRLSVREDLEAVPESRIWERPVPDMVSPANLALHLAGNLRHFFGHLLAGSDFARDREREFRADRREAKAEVLRLWDEACVEARATLLALEPRRLGEAAPVDGWPGGGNVRAYVLRLLTHLTYHAGQVRALRRLLAS